MYNFENLFNIVTGCKGDISLWFSLLSSRGKTIVTVKNSGKTLFLWWSLTKKGVGKLFVTSMNLKQNVFGLTASLVFKL